MPNEVELPDPSKMKENEWIESCISLFKKYSEQFKDTIFICNPFPPERIEWYQKLQSAVARHEVEKDKEKEKIWEVESSRPTIYLKIRGSQADAYKTPPTEGFFGGVGPVSDSNIITGIIKEISQKPPAILETYSVDLFSCPPPRPELTKNLKGLKKAINEGAPELIAYNEKINSFIKASQCKKYFAFSNTAHINAWLLEEKLKGSKGKFINLADKTVDTIKKGSTVLVLGTAQAAKARMYPNKLKSKGIDAILPKQGKRVKEGEQAEQDEQEYLQGYINAVKSGSEPLTKLAGIRFVKYIYDKLVELNKSNPPLTHILLSCTEFPLALESLGKPGEKNPIKILKAKLHEIDEGVSPEMGGQKGILREMIDKLTVVDSEHVFIQSVVNEHMSLLAEPVRSPLPALSIHRPAGRSLTDLGPSSPSPRSSPSSIFRSPSPLSRTPWSPFSQNSPVSISMVDYIDQLNDHYNELSSDKEFEKDLKEALRVYLKDEPKDLTSCQQKIDSILLEIHNLQSKPPGIKELAGKISQIQEVLNELSSARPSPKAGN